MNKILSIIVTPFALLLLSAALQLFTSTSKADHLAQELPTQKNKQTDLFNESIDDLSNFTNKLEAGKQNGINSMGGEHGSPQGLQYITQKSKAELSGESAKLESIHENDLAGKGREEMIKSNSLNELYTDYSRPLNKQHLKDAKTIAAAQDELLQNLLGELKNLGVDCKTVKGDKKVEPEYFLQTKNTNHKDTIYNQTFCEELRNKYNCRDTVTLKCVKKGIKYEAWQNRTIVFSGAEINHSWKWMWYSVKLSKKMFICYFRPDLDVTNSLKGIIAQRLVVAVEQIGTLSYGYQGWRTGTGRGKEYMFPEYIVNYQYRDVTPICEQWAEDWTERCTIK